MFMNASHLLTISNQNLRTCSLLQLRANLGHLESTVVLPSVQQNTQLIEYDQKMFTDFNDVVGIPLLK